MNWFKQLYNKTPKNIFYKKIVTSLRRFGIDSNFLEAYYLGGCVYTSENYKNILLAVENNTIFEFFDIIQFNSQKDNVELYLINYGNGEEKLIILYDPYELYRNEEILDVLSPRKDMEISNGLTKRIYP